MNALEYDPFNIYPFRMGNLDDITREKKDHCMLGGSTNGVELEFEFGEMEGKIFEQRVTVKPSGLKDLTISRNGSAGAWRLVTRDFDASVSPEELSYDQVSQWLAFAVKHGDFPYREELEQVHESRAGQVDYTRKVELNKYLKELAPKLPRNPILIESVSPFLEPPQRQYGAQHAFPIEPEEARKLSEIGQELGLFEQVRIRRTGHASFELEVAIDNQFFNISDVGLGVHAALPILGAMRGGAEKILLLQQPEAHLHPVAQARLAELMANSNHQFVIESYSDFIINRLSICVRKEILDSADIGILWLERIGSAVTIHSLSFDRDGNLLNAPPRYREFFNKETDDFLGIEPHVYADDN